MLFGKFMLCNNRLTFIICLDHTYYIQQNAILWFIYHVLLIYIDYNTFICYFDIMFNSFELKED